MTNNINNKFSIGFELKDYRAIKEANILLSGITVVAGENGCGKSTLSQILYYIFKISTSYEHLVVRHIQEELKELIFFILSIYPLQIPEREKEILQSSFFNTEDFHEKISLEEFKKATMLALKEIQHLDILDKSDENAVHTFSKRFKLILQSISMEFIPADKLKEGDASTTRLLDLITQFANQKFNEALQLIKSRSGLPLRKELTRQFHSEILPQKLEVKEIDQPLFSLDNDSLSLAYGTSNALYIDTPMLLGEKSEQRPHWNEINSLLKNKHYSANNNSVVKIIRETILKGDVSYNDDVSSPYFLNFHRSDGKIFNLLDCATGIKSFAIIQMLLKLGHISSKTLLVFDEPESHLHPQWIVEYARMIVLMHRYVGTKFFIATHNPDFISAIRYIAEKESILESVNFYLAEKDSQLEQYSYKHTATDIEPLFASFNRALDYIEKYGV